MLEATWVSWENRCNDDPVAKHILVDGVSIRYLRQSFYSIPSPSLRAHTMYLELPMSSSKLRFDTKHFERKIFFLGHLFLPISPSVCVFDGFLYSCDISLHDY